MWVVSCVNCFYKFYIPLKDNIFHWDEKNINIYIAFKNIIKRIRQFMDYIDVKSELPAGENRIINTVSGIE